MPKNSPRQALQLTALIGPAPVICLAATLAVVSPLRIDSSLSIARPACNAPLLLEHVTHAD